MKRSIKMKRSVKLSMALLAGILVSSPATVVAQVEPFVYRAPLEPYRIHQLPDFMIHSRAHSDLVIQRGVFPQGVGGWHTHAGPSLAYVVQGRIMLQYFDRRRGCTETPVYGPGDVYINPPNEIHSAIVLSEEDVVEMIVRFNFPVNGPLADAADNPGCPLPAVASALEAAGSQSHHVAVTLDDFFVQQVAPFTFRGAVAPYRIQQLPDFQIQSRVWSDLVFQRLVFDPGPGGWHIHPGPSFIHVLHGEIKLQKFSEKDGCVETPVYGPGSTYFEIGNEVHRAVVVSEDPAVLLVVRFNIPIGGPITVPMDDPGCFQD